MALFPKKNADSKAAPSLAIAYSIKSKPKMAKGGLIKDEQANTESRPMPSEKARDSKMASQNSGDKAPAMGDDAKKQSDISKQAKMGKTFKLKRPAMVPSSVFTAKLRDQEDDLQNLFEGGHVSMEMGEGPEQDNEEHPTGLEEDNDQMRPSEDEIMADHFAEGGMADANSYDEEEIEHAASIAAAIMARRKMAEGGAVDIEENAEEMPNELDSRNSAILKENYDDGMDDLEQPEGSNEHSPEHEDEDIDDKSVVGAIRRKMKSRSAITK